MLQKFFFFVLFFPLYLFCQEPSPGGVLGEALWLKPVLFTEDSLVLRDYSGYNQSVRIYSDRGYPKKSYLNFNSALSFSGMESSKDYLEVYKMSGVRTSTLIGVYESEFKNLDKDIVEIKGGDIGDIIFSTDKIKKNNGEEDLDYGSIRGEDLVEDVSSGDYVKPRVMSYYRYSSPRISLWGEGSSPSRVVFSGNIEPESGLKFQGLLGEFIAYDRVLTPTERQRVESYLSIKYGIHQIGDYLDSSSRQIWDSNKQKDYHHRVSGIGRDDASSLLQVKTTSSYDYPRGLLTISRTLYKQDPFCSGCIEYELENVQNVERLGHTLENSSKGISSWGDSGGYLDIPFNLSGTFVSFEFNSGGREELMLGLSYREYDRHWASIDYGLRRTSEQDLLWCKSGKCEELGIKHHSQKFRIGIVEDQIVLSIDGSVIKTESKGEGPLYVDFSLKESGARIENLGLVTPRETREFIDREYYVWGDDNHALNVSTQRGISGLTVLDRHWKMQISNEGISAPLFTSVEIDKQYLNHFFPSQEGYQYFLIKDRSGRGDFSQIGEVDFYPARLLPMNNREKLIAHEVKWGDKSKEEVFTIGYTSSFLARVVGDNPKCNGSKGSITIDLITGKDLVPIDYEVKSGDDVVGRGTIAKGEDNATISNLLAGKYDLTLTGNGGERSQYVIELESPSRIVLDISEKVNIGHTGVIEIDASKNQTKDMIYHWTGPNGFVYEGAKASLNSLGVYTVTAIDSEGCSSSKSIEVTKSNIKDIVAYPVRLKVGEELTVDVELLSPERVKLEIYDMSGNRVYSKERSVLSTNHSFNLELPRIGVYRGVVITPSTKEEFGIIVD